jgi:hypothetical protein
MSVGRLNASVEATALIRKAQSAGDFAALLHKGDSERGAILLVVRSRGAYVACLERNLNADGTYRWGRSGPDGGEGEAKLRDFLDRRARFDEDSWLIELDVAQPERFIAETTSAA